MTTTVKILAFITFFLSAPAIAAPWHLSGAVLQSGPDVTVNLNVTDESGSGVAGLRPHNFRVSYGEHIHAVHEAKVRDDLFTETAQGNYTLVLAMLPQNGLKGGANLDYAKIVRVRVGAISESRAAGRSGARNRIQVAPRLADFTQRGIVLLPGIR